MTNTSNIPSDWTLGVEVAPVELANVPVVVDMLREFAAYESATYGQTSEPVRSTPRTLETVMFSSRPMVFGFLARCGLEPAGIYLTCETYSTFAASRRMNAEDLYVRPKFRSAGVGPALLSAVARHGIARGCVGLYGSLLACNTPVIRLYRAIGATFPTERLNFSITGEALHALADGRFWNDCTFGVEIAPVELADVPVVVDMLGEFAAYESATYDQTSEPVRSTPRTLEAEMFSSRPMVFGFLARCGLEPAGVYLVCETYSTFAGSRRMNAEDLYVRPKFRNAGVGPALLCAVARHGIARGCMGLYGSLLASNKPVIGLYRAIGATFPTERLNFSIESKALHALADGRFWSAMPGGALPGPVDVRRAR